MNVTSAAAPPTALDSRTCLRAFRSRDPRFSGRFFVGVTSTGIYCRPGCPAPLPKPRHMRYFACAAAAEDAGFRACLRCRPETAPGTPAWRGTSATVSRALKQIFEADAEGVSADALADRLGMGERHLRRLFAEHLGTSPAALVRTRRLHFARRLLDETNLPMTQVALGAGFTSVRRFNEAIQRSFGRAPRELRRLRALERRGREAAELRLSYRPPYDWKAMLSFLASRTVPGVESVREGVYRRTVAFGAEAGIVTIRPLPDGNAITVGIEGISSEHLMDIARRAERLFDLGADPEAVAAALREDPLLAPLVRRRPGLRVPGAWDPFELAVRAILGQQVSVASARSLAGRLAALFGTPLPNPADGLTHTFPSSRALATADLVRAGVIRARAEAIRELARGVVAGAISLATPASLDAAVAALTRIPGVGPWTAHVVALRGLGEPDAFPAGDLGIRKALARNGRLPSAREVERRAAGWKPWRAYAALHLWNAIPNRRKESR